MKRRTRLAIAASCALAVFAVPSAAFAETQHTVVSGDTLWAIGIANNTTWQALAAYNHIQNPNLIFVGQTIVIPDSSSPAIAEEAPVPVQHYTPPARVYTSTTNRDYVPSSPTPSGGGIWACIGYHESGNNPATNTGNGYYGAFQDTISAWQAGGGGPGLPSDYSYAQQLAVNQRLQSMVGWGAWPNTSRMCGA